MESTPLHKALEEYNEKGYVVFRNVIDEELIAETREHVEWLQRKNPHLRPERLNYTLVQNDPFWVRLVSDDRLLDIAEQFIGSNIALFASHYICKPPFDGRPVLWHQDGSYWPLEPMEGITLWLAVDDSLPENGCLRVIPGTHRMDLHEVKKYRDIESVLNSEIDPSLVEEDKAVDVVLKAGDVSVHHPNIIHGSNPNHSPLRRCGLTIRYIPTTTKILTDKPVWEAAFLLRGKEITPGLNRYNPFPKYIEGEHMPFRGCENWK